MLGYTETPIQAIQADWLTSMGVTLLVKREDLNHRYVSGNKWWKLKYNLEEAHKQGHTKLLTFGGAYSNHIHATAAAASILGFESVGIIRGEETLPLNPTLSFAIRKGMKVHYVTRQCYREKENQEKLKEWLSCFGACYIIPEGGTNDLAVKGCAEWGAKMAHESTFDYVCLPVGTGGTCAGLIEGLGDKAKVIGFSVLKGGGFLEEEIRKRLVQKTDTPWQLITGYDQGGYAKTNSRLDHFIRQWNEEYHVPLEPVYSGKMMFGVIDLIRTGFFKPGSTILALHTGGLQGSPERKEEFNP